jgi:hypothetical protein
MADNLASLLGDPIGLAKIAGAHPSVVMGSRELRVRHRSALGGHI